MYYNNLLNLRQLLLKSYIFDIQDYLIIEQLHNQGLETYERCDDEIA